MSYSDGFFDTPAGYSDADLEMAALEDRGTRYAQRFAGFDATEIQALKDGATLTAVRTHKTPERRISYAVSVRSYDSDEVGPCLEWSLDGQVWKGTPRAAWEDWCRRTGSLTRRL